MIRFVTCLLTFCGLVGIGLCSDKTDQLVEEALSAINAQLNHPPLIDDFKLVWEWKHWLVFHQTAILSCQWGRVYPLEKLAREDHAEETVTDGTKTVNVKLTSSGLGYRFDSCVLTVDGKQVAAEPLWGDLPDNLFDLSLTVSSTPSGCNVEVRNISMISPALTFNPDNKIFKEMEKHNSQRDFTEAIRIRIQESVNEALGVIVGKTFPLLHSC